MENARDLARRYVQAALHPHGHFAGASEALGVDATTSSDADDEGLLEGGQSAEPDEHSVLAAVTKLSPEDRGLFYEIAKGTLREWHFLEWTVRRFAKRTPGEKTKGILGISAYQLLFLDRVPNYAVYSEAHHLGEAVGISEPEQKFVHGVLKSIEREKDVLLASRAESLERLENGGIGSPGHKGSEEQDWAVLNAPPALVDSLTLEDPVLSKKEARRRAVRAVAAMRKRPRMLGRILPQSDFQEFDKIESSIAPAAVAVKFDKNLVHALRDGKAWIQGEASQWVCEKAVAELRRAKAPGEGLFRIVEMASGRGGKIIGTLAAWTSQLGGDPEAIPSLQWIATDASQAQLDLLEANVAPIVQKLWPQVLLDIRRWDWQEPLPWDDLGAPRFVWLDAPCSGFGTLSKLPQIALKRGMHAYDEALKLSAIQKKLLGMGSKILGSQGTLFYTVCTMTKPETVDIVAYADSELGRKPKFSETLWPGSPPAPEAEGFFAAFF